MGTNEVAAALAAHRAEVGPRVLALPEDQWFDRKSAAIAPKDLAVALVAFANAEGGIVVVGASNGQVRGLAAARKRVNELRQASVNFTVPPVLVHVREVECVNDDGAPDILLAVHVDVGERVHELTNGECYLRVGDSSHKLSYVQRQELDFDKGQAQYDGYTATGVNLDDLDTSLVNNYRSRTGASGTTEALLGARGGYVSRSNRDSDGTPRVWQTGVSEAPFAVGRPVGGGRHAASRRTELVGVSRRSNQICWAKRSSNLDAGLVGTFS